MRGGPTAGQLESPSGLDVRDLLSSKTSASAITTIQELESDGEARIPGANGTVPTGPLGASQYGDSSCPGPPEVGPPLIGVSS